MADQEISAGLTRLPDWESRLSELVAERLSEPFVWGVNDCVLFAADCVLAMTGHDPVADVRGLWGSQGQARRVITRLGGLQAGVEALGLKAISPLYAQRGDLVLHRRDGADAMAICLGPHLAGPSDSGLLFFGLECGVQAWRVGSKN